MSEVLRIALVAEGPTDRIVIEAIVGAVLGERPFVIRILQPQGSLAFGTLGGGWSGVYRWCKQAAPGSMLRRTAAELFTNNDLLIIHLDADVAGKSYASGNLQPEARDGALPCARPCPPARDGVDALRAVVLGWCGEPSPPPRVVFCIPAQSTETWVVHTLFPNDMAVKSGAPFECHPDPESRLAQQPRSHRIRKSQNDYRRRRQDLAAGWPALVDQLGEARRFHDDLSQAIP